MGRDVFFVFVFYNVVGHVSSRETEYSKDLFNVFDTTKYFYLKISPFGINKVNRIFKFIKSSFLKTNKLLDECSWCFTE